MGNHVLLEKKGYKAYIILNKPEKLNALDMEMYSDIREYLIDVDNDPNIRVLILKGSGRAFTAGYDIAEEMSAEQPILEERNEIRDICNDNRWRIWNLSKPVIAQIHGYCFGGGCELALPADYVIAAEGTSIGEPEIQFGAAPVFLMVPWLTGIRKSKELLFTGEKIPAAEAAACGLITRTAPAEELEAEVEALADKLIKISPPALFIQKIGINRVFETMGMKTSLDTWLDLSMFFRVLKTEEVEEFSRIADEKGVKAALKWRDEYFAAKQSE